MTGRIRTVNLRNINSITNRPMPTGIGAQPTQSVVTLLEDPEDDPDADPFHAPGGGGQRTVSSVQASMGRENTGTYFDIPNVRKKIQAVDGNPDHFLSDDAPFGRRFVDEYAKRTKVIWSSPEWIFLSSVATTSAGGIELLMNGNKRALDSVSHSLANLGTVLDPSGTRGGGNDDVRGHMGGVGGAAAARANEVLNANDRLNPIDLTYKSVQPSALNPQAGANNNNNVIQPAGGEERVQPDISKVPPGLLPRVLNGVPEMPLDNTTDLAAWLLKYVPNISGKELELVKLIMGQAVSDVARWALDPQNSGYFVGSTELAPAIKYTINHIKNEYMVVSGPAITAFPDLAAELILKAPEQFGFVVGTSIPKLKNKIPFSFLSERGTNAVGELNNDLWYGLLLAMSQLGYPIKSSFRRLKSVSPHDFAQPLPMPDSFWGEGQ